MTFDRLSDAGRMIFALALIGFGLQFLAYALTGAGGPVAPLPTVPDRGLASGLGLILIVVGAGILVRKAARAIAMLVGVALLIYAVAGFLRPILRDPHNPGPWTSGSEILALAGACLALRSEERKAMLRTGELLFAAALIVFGVQHFLYSSYVAQLIPAWLPARLFWARFTGAAFLAGALGIATRVLGKLAAACVGTLFFLILLLIHVPLVVNAMRSGEQWTNALLALAMMGGGFILAGDVTGAEMEAAAF